MPILAGPDWAVNLTGVYVHEELINTSATKAVFDVTEKYFRLPKSDFVNLLPYLVSNFNQCDVHSLYTFCPSAALDPNALPSFNLSLGNYDFLVPAECYSYTVSGGIVLAFRESNGEEWILGAQFLTEFFAYFNIETRSINITGGVPSPNRIKVPPTKGDLEVWVVALIWSLGFVVVGSFCCSMLVWKLKKLSEDRAYQRA